MAISHTDSPDRISLAADIVAVYVSYNSVPTGGLGDLISSVHLALANLDAVNTVPQPEPDLMPAVSVKKSLTPDYLICLDDGKRFKSLKRHLAGLGMTPAQYRKKWGLPENYPMVAANYAATRSTLAKKIGFGQIRKDAGTEETHEVAAETAAS